MKQAQDDFVKLFLAFITIALVILIAMPLGIGYLIVSISTLVFTWLMQLYWNRHLKPKQSIQQGLKEAEEIHSGKREGKTFDDFLNELP